MLPYQIFVPGLVGGCAALDVVDDVEDEEADEEHRTDNGPHHLPVPVRPMPQHVLDVFFKPVNDKQHQYKHRNHQRHENLFSLTRFMEEKKNKEQKI